MSSDGIMTAWVALDAWRAVGADGSLWAESSDELEVRASARPGDTVQRLWHRVEQEWRDDD